VSIVLILVAVLTFFVVGMVKTGRSRLRTHGAHRLVWHWLSGLPWHGREVTDAGWSRPGTKAFTRNGHARRWWYRPRRVRAAWRSSSTTVVLAVLWGLAYHTAVTVAVLLGAAAAVTLGAALAAWRWYRGWSHRRQWVRPTHLVAAPLVGLPVATDPAEWLIINRDRSRVVIMLPPAWKGEAAERSRLVDVVSARLALDAPEVRWALAGAKPRVELTQSTPPPARVSLADAMPALESAKDDEFVWGIGRKLAVVKTSLSGDSPHAGLSMGSGAGKSVTARSLLAQQLARGAIGIVLDVKMISHQWAANLPNVVIYRRPAEIHDALIWLGEEVNRRNEVALAGADMDGNVNADVGPRLVIVFEEMNAAIAQLKSYWQGIRTKDDPKRSPALTALDLVSFTGRQVKAHLVYIGQRLSNQATGGGGDGRENIGVIAFARYRATTWKMLAPDFPMPAKNLTPGRVQVVSDSVRECQGIFMAPAEARAWSVSGIVSPLPYGMPGARHSDATSVAPGAIDVAENVAPDTAVSGTSVAVRTDPDLCVVTGASLAPSGPVSLREAVEAGVMSGLTLGAARLRRHRDPSFPAAVERDGTTELYALDDLIAYAGAEIRLVQTDLQLAPAQPRLVVGGDRGQLLDRLVDLPVAPGPGHQRADDGAERGDGQRAERDQYRRVHGPP
jgi:hypothetical protein